MSELISGKDAINNWYDGIETEIRFLGNMKWYPIDTDEVSLDDFKDSGNSFRIKPITIKLNGVEVPAPFKPKEGDMVWCLNELSENGYEARTAYDSDDFIAHIAYWRTESDIKQVVEALQNIFNNH